MKKEASFCLTVHVAEASSDLARPILELHSDVILFIKLLTQSIGFVLLFHPLRHPD